MTNEMLSGRVTLEEMKDKFLIQDDILSSGICDFETLSYLRRDGELNHGIRECKTGGWEAKPWGLDGLVLHMNYDEDIKFGWYDIQCRFRLSGDIVLRLDKKEQKLSPDQVLYSDTIKADSKEEFLRIMQESIDSSYIYLLPGLRRYDIIFRNVCYTVGSIIDEYGFIAYFFIRGIGMTMLGKTISIRPIDCDDKIDIETGITCNISLVFRESCGVLMRD